MFEDIREFLFGEALERDVEGGALSGLKLCEEHKQEWKQSHYAKSNCDHCKALALLPEVSQNRPPLPKANGKFNGISLRPSSRSENSMWGNYLIFHVSYCGTNIGKFIFREGKNEAALFRNKIIKRIKELEL